MLSMLWLLLSSIGTVLHGVSCPGCANSQQAANLVPWRRFFSLRLIGGAALSSTFLRLLWSKPFFLEFLDIVLVVQVNAAQEYYGITATREWFRVFEQSLTAWYRLGSDHRA